MFFAECAGQRHAIDLLSIGAFRVIEWYYSTEGALVLLGFAGLSAFRAKHLYAFIVFADDCVQSIFIAYLAIGVLFSELYGQVLWYLDFLFLFLLFL